MPIAKWKDEYIINIEEIDIQHQKMIKLVNNLHSSVEARIDKSKLEILLVELVDYTRMHFSTEEKYMEKSADPSLKLHHKEHNSLLKHLEQLVAAVAKGQRPTFFSDYDLSSDWMISHITEHDKKMGVYLNSKGIY
jgi:hemerythrin-like metal-binding protein